MLRTGPSLSHTALACGALALFACAEPQLTPPADAAAVNTDGGVISQPMDGGGATPPRDAGLVVVPEAGTTPPTGSVCEQACRHVYQDCRFAFRTSTGQTATEAQCVQACAAGGFNGAESCLRSAQCTQTAVNACLSGSAPPTDAGAPPPPPPADGGASNPPGNPTLEDQVLAIVNQRRAAGANCGGTNYPPVGPVAANELLRLAARRHSLDMGTRGYFDHNTPEGITPFQRIAATGYTGSPQGENIAAGNATAEATMTQWMNSPGHCRNIMNGQYRALGVGYANVRGSRYTHYWTQNFGGR